ncbi:MAG: HAMP domain-containing histidine kinase [Planctomycetota bacterium]|nr:HAMP domain-containing histidine kinase [Planctomycetota bacterium]
MAGTRDGRGVLAGLSHELRAPLQTLLGNLDLLADGTLGELTEEQREAVQGASKQAEKILAIARDVLQVARIDAGKERVVVGDVALDEVIAREVADARPSAARAGLKVEIECATPLAVRSDGAKIGRILSNLLSNAIKYTNAGRIVVRAGRAGDTTFVEVEDTGPGIPHDQQQAVFDEYVRLDDTKPGTGLGLAIVQRLAALLTGRVMLHSEPGAGTRVRLDLPV